MHAHHERGTHLAGEASSAAFSTACAAPFLRPALALAALDANSFFLHAGLFLALFVLSYLRQHARVHECE